MDIVNSQLAKAGSIHNAHAQKRITNHTSTVFLLLASFVLWGTPTNGETIPLDNDGIESCRTYDNDTVLVRLKSKSIEGRFAEFRIPKNRINEFRSVKTEFIFDGLIVIGGELPEDSSPGNLNIYNINREITYPVVAVIATSSLEEQYDNVARYLDMTAQGRRLKSGDNEYVSGLEGYIYNNQNISTIYVNKKDNEFEDVIVCLNLSTIYPSCNHYIKENDIWLDINYRFNVIKTWTEKSNWVRQFFHCTMRRK